MSSDSSGPTNTQRLVATLLVFIMVGYWAITILYVSPNNFIRIRFHESLRRFGTFFFQRWNFFAPPPTYNQKLYYTFIPKSEDGDRVTIEVLEPIYVAKRLHAPFNESETILDYVLSGASEQLWRVTSERISSLPTRTGEATDDIRDRTLDPRVDLPAMRTLVGYAKFVAEKNSIDPNQYQVMISLNIEYLPKFSERHNVSDKTKRKELFCFITDPFTIN